jgi:Zn-dependent M16 (insulinase) family peptidase
MSSSFELIAKSSPKCCIPVEKYKSKRTGMKLYVCDVKGPVVDGYISLATEANSDDGLPHTLEVYTHTRTNTMLSKFEKIQANFLQD